MKKLLAFILVIAMLMPLTAGADTFTDGFDPDAVKEAMLANANAVLNDTVTMVDGSGAGKYNFYYKGQDMSTMLYIAHTDQQGNTGTVGITNHLAISVVCPSDSDSFEAYLLFWAAVAGGLMQYLSGAEEMGDLPTELYNYLMTAAESDTHYVEFTYSGYKIMVVAMVRDGSAVLGLIADIPGLY